MGNCVFKGFGDHLIKEKIKVVTPNGGTMELYAPITAETISNEFPGHAIYRSRDLFSQPLLHNQDLTPGELYYLLPLNNSDNNLVPSSSSIVTPYRMSFDNQKTLKLKTSCEVLPRYNSGGVWKVKLVISPQELADILAQDARTEALIDSVRTVAKCGNGVSSSVAHSDKWSVSSSSWKGSSISEKHAVDT